MDDSLPDRQRASAGVRTAGAAAVRQSDRQRLRGASMSRPASFRIRRSAAETIGTVLAVSLAAVAWSRIGARSSTRPPAEADHPGLDERRFRSLVQHASDIIMIVSADGLIRYVSPSVQRVLGHPVETLLGSAFVDLMHPEDREWAVPFLAGPAHRCTQLPPVAWRLRRVDGSWLHGETVGSNLLDDSAVAGLVLATRDVSERKTLEERLAHHAFHDSLTGLANRRQFQERVQAALLDPRRRASGLAVLFLDLDDFKTVNDSLGHSAGDELLVYVAQRLKRCLRAHDLPARIGGDEFAVLLDNAGSEAEVEAIAHRIVSVLDEPHTVQGTEVLARASIGIAVPGVDEYDGDSLLRNADTSMYSVKRTGKGSYTFFEAAMHERVVQQLQLDAELRHAVDRNEFVLHYQPIMHLATQAILGVEALLRWQHPTRGLLGPGEFIDRVEANGLIVPLGRWVLEDACRQLRRWDHRHGHIGLSINISARQLQDEAFLTDVRDAATKAGIDPRRLTLEITETALMRDTAATIHLLAELKQLGVRLAFDDFGTGYSSLSYLRRFPVDVVKIDRSFIEDVGKGIEESALPDAIIALCQAFRIQSVAEGIELHSQLAHLQAVGCYAGQGFYFSRPLPPANLERLLPKQSGRPAAQPLSMLQASRQPADETRPPEKLGASGQVSGHGRSATRRTNEHGPAEPC
jgi:diguanylate cyclase (GGDEF)-like protein/PAS domain S-box-containing protein